MNINKKNPCIIVQARTGSKRFPKKMLKKIGNKTVLEIILSRLKQCTKVKSVILATTNKKQDIKLTKIAKKLNVKFYCGNENDLVDRFYHAALAFNVDPIIRFPGDNLFPCPKEIDKIISHYQKKKKNNRKIFCSNIENFFNSNYPTGIGAEVFSFKILEDIYINEKSKFKREHVHKNFINYLSGKPIDLKKCKISTIKAPKKLRYPKIVLHIDYKKEYEELKEVFLHFNKVNISIEKVLKYIDKNKNEFKYLYNC